MRLLVTGSRTWSDRERLGVILDGLANTMIRTNNDRHIAEGFHLVSGHAYGADALAEQWAQDTFPLEEIEVWRADWKGLGRRAGIVRNTAMVDSNPDLCAAFIMPCDKDTCRVEGLHGSHGAVHCADYAERQGVTTFRYYGGALT